MLRQHAAVHRPVLAHRGMTQRHAAPGIVMVLVGETARQPGAPLSVQTRTMTQPPRVPTRAMPRKQPAVSVLPVSTD